MERRGGGRGGEEGEETVEGEGGGGDGTCVSLQSTLEKGGVRVLGGHDVGSHDNSQTTRVHERRGFLFSH